MIDAARSLGLTAWQTWWRVNIPLARPAIAAGALLALMETLADYGASVYFGLQTFTTAIYRAWFSMGDRVAASQLAGVLLLLRAGRARTGARRSAAVPASSLPRPANGRRRARCCEDGGPGARRSPCALLPVMVGFALPVLLLVRLLLPVWTGVDASTLLQWVANTLGVAVGSSVVVLVVVLALAYAARAAERGTAAALVRASVRLMSLGYALPGAVVAVGILVPLAGFDNALDGLLKSLIGVGTGLLLTGSVFALLYGYLVRYFAVAYQSVEAGLARITPAMDASARSLGSSTIDTCSSGSTCRYFRRRFLPPCCWCLSM